MTTTHKLTLVVLLGLSSVLMTLTPSLAAAKSGSQTCKVKTNDIGTIIGHGKTAADAFEDAATQCFDRREGTYKAHKGTGPDEEAGLVMIDVCANIKCAS